MESKPGKDWATGRQVRKDSRSMKERVPTEGVGVPTTYKEQTIRPKCWAPRSQTHHGHLMAAEEWLSDESGTGGSS